jgi:hypothetical protein
VESAGPNVAELIQDQVTLTVDCVDRVYLNVDGPRLPASGGVVSFLRHRGQRVLSPAVFGQITEAFKTGLRTWATERGIPWLEFSKGQRKDDVVQLSRDRFPGPDGAVLIGVAQERVRAWRATKRWAGASSTSPGAGPRSR